MNVHFLPALTTVEQLAGKTVVVIDVLRATTTILHALAAGARAVVPCVEIDEARQWLERGVEGLQGEMVSGGERGGLPIEGFDLGNSPSQYTPQSVGDKVVVFTTTNGTRAMIRCGAAEQVLIGAFGNLSALCRLLADRSQVELLCAGTDGQITREDVLLAGAIVARLHAARPESPPVLNDSALLAADAWGAVAGDFSLGSRRRGGQQGTWPEGGPPQPWIAEALAASRGGRNLTEIGQQQDIHVAAEIDRFDIVPSLHVATWRIGLPGRPNGPDAPDEGNHAK